MVFGMSSGSQMNVSLDVSKAIEFLPGKLSYVPLATQPKPTAGVSFFTIDNELIYWNYCLDFGPLNVGHVFRFNEIVTHKLAQAQQSNTKLVMYSNSHGQRRANAVCLLGCWGVMFNGMSADAAFAPFRGIKFPAFHDATDGHCSYDLSIVDVLRGLEKGLGSKYIDVAAFNVDEYQHYEKVENGDLSWVSTKFIAFAGPHSTFTNRNGQITLTPEHYIPYFKKSNVTLVVRLNDKCYDRMRFVNAGIDHLDLFYPDGTNAPMAILKQFIAAAEATPGVVAVHCKAGLGRTGTCIGSYMMKHELFTAREVIGWLRLCRPGSVIGPQQQFMEEIQDAMHRAMHESDSVGEMSDGALSISIRGLGTGAGAGNGSGPQVQAKAIKVVTPTKKAMLQGEYLVSQKLSHSPPNSPGKPTSKPAKLFF